MKITIEFKSVEEYLEFKEKTAKEEQVQEQSIYINLNEHLLSDILSDILKNQDL